MHFIYTCNGCVPYGVVILARVPLVDRRISYRILTGISILRIFRFGTVEMLCMTALFLWELCKRKTLREQQIGMDRSWCWAHLQSHRSCIMQIKLNPTIPAEWLFSVSWWWLSLILMRTVRLLGASCYCFFPVYFRHAECQVFYCLATVLRLLSELHGFLRISLFLHLCNWL